MSDHGLLKPEELKRIQHQLGDKMGILASAVAKLLICAPNSSSWQYSHVWGAIILSVDRGAACDPKPRLLQIIDMETFQIKFREELYEGMIYAAPKPHFHTFEGSEAVCGLLFTDKQNAEQFFNKMLANIPKPRVEEIPPERRSSNIGGGILSLLFGKKNDSIAQVGLPTDVKHNHHIGFDPERGFQVENIPNEWKEFFKEAGIKKKDLQNPESAAQIYQVMSQYSAGPPQLSQAPQPSQPPPQPPQRAPVAPPRAPPRPPRVAPQPIGNAPPAPAIPNAPAVPDAPAVPVAPAIPDAPAVPEAPQVPEAPFAPPVPPDAPHAAPAPSHNPAPSSGGRTDLLASIRNFKTGGGGLKKVDPSELKKDDDALPDLKSMDQSTATSMMQTLQAVMAARRQVMKEEEEPEEADNNDWD